MKLIHLPLVLIVLIPVIGWCDRNSDWVEDLDFYYNGMVSYHINAFSKISEQNFRQQVSQLKQQIGKKTDFQITIELMKLTRKIGDGHTAIHFQHGKKLKKFPIKIYDDAGIWRVIAIADNYKKFLGTELTHINNQSIRKLKQSLSGVVQFVENKNSLDQRVPQYIEYAELLFELGLITSPDYGVFTFSDGSKISTFEIQAEISNHGSLETKFASYTMDYPIIEKVNDAGVEDLWYGSASSNNSVYIKFGQYPSLDQMDEFGQSILTYINKGKMKNLIIDLRGNWGGDFYVGLWLAGYLNLADSIDWLNGVYTLIDKDTFSAATINAAQFKQLLNAKIVGEPTGSNPHGFQDMGNFDLPNSGLIVSYSKRLFRLQEISNQGLQPDVAINYSWEAFKNGEDNILLWVFNEIEN